ncbi:hypothetical protein ACIA58_00790 [Kribbella sp. NPDC051586]|uniref:hypothetical protein n=1 Tax=Kribbella sp. NPDC051586 TaxID=3364118 RepID=UPI00378D099C
MVNVADPLVLPELGKPKWTPAQIFAYEIALEGVRQAVAFYAHHLAAAEAAEAADEPDEAAIATLRAAQAAWAARGQELDPLDTRAVGRVRDDADELLSEDGDEEDGAGGDAGEEDAQGEGGESGELDGPGD